MPKKNILNKLIILAILILFINILIFGVINGRVNRTSPAENCFRRLPLGWQISESYSVPNDQTRAIAAKLGSPIKKLSNSHLLIHGRPIQVNIFTCGNSKDAKNIHEVVSKMKGDSAFCVIKGTRVIEYVGNDISASFVKMVSYELGFVKKPNALKYRVRAEIAAVEKSDYMSFNKLSNLFFSSADHDQIEALAKRFQFGNKLVLRKFGAGNVGSVYNFEPKPSNMVSNSNQGTVVYSFKDLPSKHSVPYVSVDAEIVVKVNEFTPQATEEYTELLSATPHWPVDDPEIVELAKQITEGYSERQEKIYAILRWLTPNKNINFGGPVEGSRWGVKKVLQQKYGQCWDFSDCFITLCRASGIPCRQVGGWLFGVSGHIWAEVLYENKGWMQVDPTGGSKIKCDLYHIPYCTSVDGNMPILYTSLPEVVIIEEL